MMALPLRSGAAQVGGSAKSPYRLLKWLAPELDHVHVMAADGDQSSLPPNCTGSVVRLRYARLFIRTLLQSAAIALHLMMHRNRYDVIQSHHPHLSAGIAVVKKLGLWRGIFILKAHGTAVPELKTNEHRGIRGVLLSLNAKILHYNDIIALRAADYVICSSRYQMAEMQEIYDVSRPKLVVIYNGYDPDIRAKAAGSGAGKSRRAVFCGRVVSKKNAPYAIALFRRLKALGILDGLDLVLGHKSRIENQEAYKAIKQAIAGEPDITVHFDVSEENLYRLFSNADVGLVPSVGYESIPSVIYEIASCGTPVFATGQWGIPEVLPSKYHLDLNLESDADRISRVLKSELDNATHAAWAQDFRYDLMAARYTELYSKGH
jgi:glycosyltransferase involved in cell wall biosynthesis